MSNGLGFAIFHVLLIILPFFFAFIHIALTSDRRLINKLNIFLLHFLWIGVGVQATLAGLSQIFNGEQTAVYLNWPYSPFVQELGYANFAFGILGLLCLVIQGTWRTATGIGYSIFLLCAAYGHVKDIIVNHNFSIGNIGPTLWSDIIISVAILVLLIWRFILNRKLAI